MNEKYTEDVKRATDLVLFGVFEGDPKMARFSEEKGCNYVSIVKDDIIITVQDGKYVDFRFANELLDEYKAPDYLVAFALKGADAAHQLKPIFSRFASFAKQVKEGKFVLAETEKEMAEYLEDHGIIDESRADAINGDNVKFLDKHGFKLIGDNKDTNEVFFEKKGVKMRYGFNDFQLGIVQENGNGCITPFKILGDKSRLKILRITDEMAIRKASQIEDKDEFMSVVSETMEKVLYNKKD